MRNRLWFSMVRASAHPTNSSPKSAKDAARAEVGRGGTTVKHPSPEVGDGHFHGMDQWGNKSRIHHEYPN
jgi:hypothetical protein